MCKWILVDDNESFINDNYEDISSDISNVFNDKYSWKEIVLCIGKVQSGKTRKIFKCIEKAFELDYTAVILLSGVTNYLYDQTLKRLYKENFDDLKVLDKQDISKSSYNSKNKYILTTLKNIQCLDEIIEFVYKIDCSNAKILIVDDESDYASVNIMGNDYSRTYQKICELFSLIPNGKLLQVTATPFANIISNNSLELKADRIVCWSNSHEYTGLHEFSERKENIYEIIEGYKTNPHSYRGLITETVKHFVSTIINNYDRLSNLEDQITCLFNIDLDKETHIIVCNHVNVSLENIKNSPLFYDRYIDKNISPDIYWKRLNSFFNNYEIIILNSDNKDIETKAKYIFYIGGTKISRGNTFENLISEIIINAPVNGKLSVDTLLQRCRWFGYRKENMDLMKIFMTKNIYDALLESEKYINILTTGIHEIQDLYTQIKILDTASQFVVSTRKD